MTTKSTQIVKQISEAYEAQHGEKPDSKFIKMVIEATLHQAMEINNQFVGRRIGEIDLNMIYREEFGISEKKSKKLGI